MKLGPYELDQIYTGDARELAKAIPDKSVDLIFTDPPYHLIHLPLYEIVAREGSRILKPGCWAFIYGGWVAKEIFDILYSGNWSYFMTIALINRNGYPRWWSKNLMIGYKPIYVFTKGNPGIKKWQTNLADRDGADKQHHVWGQGIGFAAEKIDMFSRPNDVVVDFFSGGGQVPAVCKMLGRHYLAFEIDPDTAERARQRVDNTQPPLLIPQPEQAELF